MKTELAAFAGLFALIGCSSYPTAHAQQVSSDCYERMYNIAYAASEPKVKEMLAKFDSAGCKDKLTSAFGVTMEPPSSGSPSALQLLALSYELAIKRIGKTTLTTKIVQVEGIKLQGGEARFEIKLPKTIKGGDAVFFPSHKPGESILVIPQDQETKDALTKIKESGKFMKP